MLLNAGEIVSGKTFQLSFVLRCCNSLHYPHFIMTSQIVSRLVGILAVALVGFGCKSATAPPSDPVVPVVTHDPGEFGYTYNGTSINRKDYPGVFGYGSVGYSPNYNSTGFTLDITLMLQPSTAPKERTVELRVPMPAPMTGTFTTAGGYSGTWVTLKLDTANYISKAGGTITITKFDTINNAVSGTFSFEAADGALNEKVTSGYFNDMPIYYGTFNQGLITADITIDGVSDRFTSAGTAPSPSLYTVDSGQTFVIMAQADDAATQREIDFGISNIRVGYANLDQNSGYRWFGQYHSFGAKKAAIITAGGAVGKITITNFDWKTHRMSATFYMTGYDQNTGSLIDVENGKIDNVQWFEL
jgi:hypothetical protein